MEREKASSNATRSPAICKFAKSEHCRRQGGGSGRRPAASTPEQRVDLSRELRAGERLRQIGGGADLLRGGAVLGKAARAHDEHRHVSQERSAADVLAE